MNANIYEITCESPDRMGDWLMVDQVGGAATLSDKTLIYRAILTTPNGETRRAIVAFLQGTYEIAVADYDHTYRGAPVIYGRAFMRFSNTLIVKPYKHGVEDFHVVHN